MAQQNTTNEVICLLYHNIMRDVTDASQVDFEDAGVPAAVLDELKSLWQEALSETRVGPFPWDVPAQHIKPEPTTDKYSPLIDPKNLYSMSTLTEAQLFTLTPSERHRAHAASHKENVQLAQEAARQDAAELAKMRAEMFVEQMRNTYASRTQENDIIGVPAAATGPTARGFSWGTEGAAAYLEQVRNGVNRQKGVFGSVDLGSPQSSPYKNPIPGTALETPNRSPVIKSEHVDSSYTPSSLSENRYSETSGSFPQLDGDGDDNDDDKLKGDDEGTINSDSDEFEDVTDLCVCLYDKVVRNRGKLSHKWKCSLKDGVLSMGGREYPFGKASAEFIW